MPFSVVLDTCVLYPAHLSDTLLRLAERGLYLSSQRLLRSGRARMGCVNEITCQPGGLGPEETGLIGADQRRTTAPVRQAATSASIGLELKWAAPLPLTGQSDPVRGQDAARLRDGHDQPSHPSATVSKEYCLSSAQERLKLEPSSVATSHRMSKQRRRDTEPELVLRRALHARGLRFRVGLPVPGRPRRTIDVAFPGQRLAVFVDGCFWHGCPTHGTWPKTNADWWLTKIETNRERDADTDRALVEQGWRVVRVWEHDVASGVENVVAEMSRLRGAA